MEQLIFLFIKALERKKASKGLGNTFILLLLASISISTILILLGKPLLRLLGASGELLELSYNYIRVLAYGAFLQFFGVGISPLLRNYNKTWITMVLMVGNFVIDTVFSGIFVVVLGMGVEGAAYATLMGQCIALIPALITLFKSEKVLISDWKLEKTWVINIIKTGLPIFGLTYIPSVTIIIINYQAMAYGGTAAVAAFAVASYVISIGQLLAQGIGEGSQPLISYYYGANELNSVRKLKRWTYYTGFITTIVVVFGIIALRKVIPHFFNVTDDTAEIIHTALPLFALSLPLYAFSRVTTEYFNAIKKNKLSTIMVYGEALIILPICSIMLPLAMKLNGVWVIAIVSQFLISITGFLLLKFKMMHTE